MTGLEYPPIFETVMPHNAQLAFMAGTGIPMLVVFGLAVTHIIRGKGPFFCYV